jgi:cytoskeletal protein RodZ
LFLYLLLPAHYPLDISVLKTVTKMLQNTPLRRQAGFAAVESLLVIVMVAMIGGVGYWVWSQRQITAAPAAGQTADASNASPSKQTLDPALLGSTAGEDAIDNYSLKDEEKSEDTSVTSLSASINSATAAANALGDSYNDASL